MLSEITIGQFVPGESIVHRIDPRLKLILLVVIIAVIFTAGSFPAMALCAGFTIAMIAATKIPLRLYIKGLKAILFIIIFTSFLNIFYARSGVALLEIGSFKLYDTGIYNAVFITVRIACLIFISSVLTFTTSPTALTDAMERVLKPLKLIRVPVHELTMMMTIALRFIPTLLEETEKIMNAQKARGSDFESGRLIARLKALVPVLIPLFVSCIMRAYELATAMECRCYKGGEGRTRMKVLALGRIDFAVVAFVVTWGATVILCAIFF